MNRIFLFCCITLLPILATAQELRAPATSHLPTIRVMTTLEPLAFFASEIGRELVEAQAIVPYGVCPESFEPTIKQAQLLAKAQVLIKVGHPALAFETQWLPAILADYPDIRTVDASDGIGLIEHDPHLWMSANTAKLLSESIAAVFAEMVPTKRDFFIANKNSLVTKINVLDAELKHLFANRSGSSFLVLHPAWAYLAKDYNLHQLAVENEGKEPSPLELAKIISQAKELKFTEMFVQPGLPPDSAEVFRKELGVRILYLDPLKKDWLANMHETAILISNSLR